MGTQLNTCGYFGKLPIRGDFIQRNLPSEFVKMWDHWLQTVISSSQRTLNDQWLNTYLVSPIWRFFLSIDTGQQYTGILLPSVDKVGRYFPFTIAMQLNNKENIIQFVSENEDWYTRAENIAIQALDENIDFEQLNQAIDNLVIIENEDQNRVFEASSKAYHIKLTGKSIDTSISQIQSRITIPEVKKTMSYWWNMPTTEHDGDLICYLGMPDDNIYVAMLDGQWELSHANHIKTTNN